MYSVLLTSLEVTLLIGRGLTLFQDFLRKGYLVSGNNPSPETHIKGNPIKTHIKSEKEKRRSRWSPRRKREVTLLDDSRDFYVRHFHVPGGL